MSNFSDSNILITGGNGFIGSHLINRLSTDYPSISIHVFDLLHGGNFNTLIKENPNLFFHEVDVTDAGLLHAKVKEVEPTHVFHLAAFVDVGRNFSKLGKVISVNVEGTSNLLHALENQRIKTFIHVGTSEVYGNNDVPFREEMVVHPRSPYSASKASSELFTQVFSLIYEIPTVYLRLFNVYGEGQSENMLIPQVIRSCLRKENIKITKGEQTRESNYVGDVVEGIIKAAQSDKAVGEIINLGCGEEVSIKALVKKIIDMMDSPIEPKFGALPYRKLEVWRMVCDNRKAKRLLDWEPKNSLEGGLLRTIRWYEEKHRTN